MKYLKRYNRFSFQTNCRICLTQSVTKMLALDAPLKGDMGPKPLVYEALELVMSEKVNLSEEYPSALCAVCAELLKISYELKIQYRQSQKKLRVELGELPTSKADSKKTKDGKALVEILVGSEKFNIQDVFIVEEENENDQNFQGFLSNLGKTISASFVGKNYTKPKLAVEAPSLVIEKLCQDQKNTTINKGNNKSHKEIYTENAYSSVYEEQITVVGHNEEDFVIDEAEIVDNYADVADNDAEIVDNDSEVVDNEAEIVDNNADNVDNDAEIVDNDADNVDNDAEIVDNHAEIVDGESENIDDMFIDVPVNEDIMKKFITSTDKDKAALQSAMNFKYRCPYCEKPMASLNKVKLHTSQTCTKNNANSRCYVCGKRFNSRKQLLIHLKLVHLVKIKKAQELDEHEKHKCHLCGKVFQSHGSLFYHISKHKGRRYGCDQCDKLFYTKSQASNHRQTHNREDTLVVCPICGKGFHYQSGLFYHMKMHTNERNYQCSFCPRRFYARNSLKRHELTHTGGRPYACKYCDKKFRSLGEVKKHELLHTGERPYHCNYCTLGFTQAHNLKVHLMTHPGSHLCPHCCRGFPEQEILRFHLQNKHGISENTEDNIYLDEVEEPETVREEFFLTGEYVDEESRSIVQTYEAKDDEVLVETVEENMQ